MYRRKGILWGLLAGILWGLDGVLMGIYFSSISLKSSNILIVSIIAACIHDGLAALWILIKNLISGKFKLYRQIIKSSALKPLLLGSMLGGPIGMTGNLLAIQLAGISYASAITATYPVIGAVLGRIFLKETIKLRGTLGIATAVFGAIIVGYTPPKGTSDLYFYIGIVFAILAIFGWALEGVISTYCMSSIDSDVAIGIREITSFVTYFLMLIILSSISHKIFIIYVNYKCLWLLALASFIGAFSYFCWYRSMNFVGVSIAMSLNITYALWSVIFCFLLIGLKLTYGLIIGVSIITIGAILTILGTKK